MDIVLPVHHFPPRYTAGAELITTRYAHWLLAHGHRVEAVCIERIDQGDGRQISAERDEYQGIPVWRLALNLAAAPDRFRWTYDNPLIGRWFIDYLERTQPTLVHVQGGYLITTSVLEAAHTLGIPTVLSAHDYWYLCPRITLLRSDGTICDEIPQDPAGCSWCMLMESRRYRLPNQVTRGLAGKIALAAGMSEQRQAMAARRARLAEALDWANAVVAPSRFLASRFAPLVQRERLHVSRYGLDLGPFLAQPRRTPDGTLRFGFTGQIAPHKGVHTLIDAFRRLEPAAAPIELHIYGGLDVLPRYVAHLRQLAGDDPRIHLHGRFENRDVAAIVAGLDLLIVPSNWYEVGPLTIMEAFAVGTPVIAAALGNMADLVHDGVDGLHFRPDDAADLAHQLRRIRDDPELLPRLRQGIVPPISIDDEMRTLLRIYEDAIAHRGACQEAA